MKSFGALFEGVVGPSFLLCITGYGCKDICGAPTVRADLLDRIVREYISNLLSEPVQLKLAQFLRSYKNSKKDCKASFAAAIEKQIKAKEKEYESLLDNMGQSVLSPDILDDITARMKTLKEEIKTLKNTTPPEEASTELIVNWLRAIREAPDSRAVHLLIEKVEIFADKEKTDFHIVSTLESVSENLVRVEITDSAPNDHIPANASKS